MNLYTKLFSLCKDTGCEDECTTKCSTDNSDIMIDDSWEDKFNRLDENNNTQMVRYRDYWNGEYLTNIRGSSYRNHHYHNQFDRCFYGAFTPSFTLYENNSRREDVKDYVPGRRADLCCQCTKCSFYMGPDFVLESKRCPLDRCNWTDDGRCVDQ